MAGELEAFIGAVEAVCAELQSTVDAVRGRRRSARQLLAVSGQLAELCEQASADAAARDDEALRVAAHDVVQHVGVVVRAHMIINGIGDKTEHLDALSAAVAPIVEAARKHQPA